ncbi:hypothetical protein Tco_1268978 [Tanacetum coccineum]
MGYSAIVSPLTDLLKKNQAWIWDEECQAAFESLKKAVMKELFLNARWTPDRIREPKVKQDGKEKLSPKQARWQDFLAEFDYQLEYKLGKANVVADALSRKAKFAAITEAQFFLQDRIKEGLEHDPLAKKIIVLAKDGKTQRFWLKEDMLFTKGDRLYVPK